MMDSDMCDMNHLDSAEVLLPPRKRLLTGYKKRAFVAAEPHHIVPAVNVAGARAGAALSRLPCFSSTSVSPYSRDSSSPLVVSPPPSPTSTRFQCHLSDILNSHFHDNLTPEEIVMASRSAADAAVKAAEEARAVAQDKAALAAKAVAAAKEALAMVAAFSEKEAALANEEEKRVAGKKVVGNREMIHMRKKKLKKKHVQVQVLYNKKDQQPPIRAGGMMKHYPASAGCIEL